MSDATIIYSQNRAHQNYRDLSQGAVNAVPRGRRIFDEFSDTQFVGRERRDVISMTTVAIGCIVFLGILIGLAVLAYVDASSHAYLLALGFGIVGSSMLGLRAVMGRVESDLRGVAN